MGRRPVIKDKTKLSLLEIHYLATGRNLFIPEKRAKWLIDNWPLYEEKFMKIWQSGQSFTDQISDPDQWKSVPSWDEFKEVDRSGSSPWILSQSDSGTRDE